MGLWANGDQLIPHTGGWLGQWGMITGQLTPHIFSHIDRPAILRGIKSPVLIDYFAKLGESCHDFEIEVNIYERDPYDSVKSSNVVTTINKKYQLRR